MADAMSEIMSVGVRVDGITIYLRRYGVVQTLRRDRKLCRVCRRHEVDGWVEHALTLSDLEAWGPCGWDEIRRWASESDDLGAAEVGDVNCLDL